MITQEMRELRMKPAAPPLPPASPAATQCVEIADQHDMPRHQPGGAVRLGGPTQVSLRRDGHVPIRFTGYLVYQVNTAWNGGTGAFNHRVALYRDQASVVYAALELIPKPAVAMRPIYWAQPIPETHVLDNLLDNWCRNVVARGLNPDRPASLQDARSALHSMTAHSLRVAKPDTERNNTCLQ